MEGSALNAWLAASALFFAVGEYASKKWSLAPGAAWLLGALFAYNVGTLAWFGALRGRDLAVVGTVWSAASLLATVLIGVVLFREPVTWRLAIGVALAAGAMWCLA